MGKVVLYDDVKRRPSGSLMLMLALVRGEDDGNELGTKKCPEHPRVQRVPLPLQRVPPIVKRVQPPRAAKSNLVSYAHAVTCASNGRPLTYNQLMCTPLASTWKISFANELGRLAQGVGTRIPTGSNTIQFISHTSVPSTKHVTYGRLVLTEKPHKTE